MVEAVFCIIHSGEEDGIGANGLSVCILLGWAALKQVLSLREKGSKWRKSQRNYLAYHRLRIALDTGELR